MSLEIGRSRRRSRRSLAGPRLVAALALGGLVGLFSADVAKADAEEPAVAAPAASAEAAAVEGRIEFVGRNVFGRAEGTFGEWRVVERAVDLANPAASAVVVEVALASVDTGNADRDEHLRTADFFDVATHPVATVRGHSARPLEPSAAGHPRHAVRFDVDLHGVKKTLDGEVEIVGTDPVVVEGGFLIRRTDFGIGSKPSAWNPLSIDDEVPVRFRIEFE